MVVTKGVRTSVRSARRRLRIPVGHRVPGDGLVRLAGAESEPAVASAKGKMATVNLVMQDQKGARDAYMVLGHDSRMGQVLRNLIDNARSFTAAGTAIQIRLRRVGDEIEARIEDLGPGIAPENLERIFERFYTDRPEQNFGGNSGLGLAISRQVMEAHKGRIWAENRYGNAAEGGARPVLGARFILRFPAMPAGWKAET